MSDPRLEANTYLKRHKVLELFEELGAKMLVSKTEDLNGFLQKELKELKRAKEEGQKKTFFTEKDISTMFSMFDPTGRGVITASQYANALKSLGVMNPQEKVEGGSVDRETFETTVRKELEALSLTA